MTNAWPAAKPAAPAPAPAHPAAPASSSASEFVVRESGSGAVRFKSASGLSAADGRKAAEAELAALKKQQPERTYTIEDHKG
jgi:hypothetical protein